MQGEGQISYEEVIFISIYNSYYQLLTGNVIPREREVQDAKDQGKMF